jgi:hypothetical protein
MAEPLADAPTENLHAIEGLRRLLHDGRTDEARGLLEELRARGMQNPELERWGRILRPPRAHLLGEARSSTHVAENGAWLRENGAKYFGQWVALRKGQLLAANASPTELYRELERRGELADALFVKLAAG